MDLLLGLVEQARLRWEIGARRGLRSTRFGGGRRALSPAVASTCAVGEVQGQEPRGNRVRCAATVSCRPRLVTRAKPRFERAVGMGQLGHPPQRRQLLAGAARCGP